MAKSPTPTKGPRRSAAAEAAPADERGPKITIVVRRGEPDEQRFPLYPDEIPVRVELELWKTAGLRVAEVVRPEYWTRPFLCSVIWLSRRCTGETISWDAVALDTPFPAQVDILYGEDPEETGPKASGGSPANDSPS